MDISIILAIVVLVMVLNLQGRVKKLERLAGLRSEEKKIEKVVAPIGGEVEIRPVQPIISTTNSEPDWLDKFSKWVKEDWILKLGALFLLVGFGWLTSYAFANNWIGPMGRIVLGIVAGVLILILGWWRIKKYIHQGGIFMVLGSTVILLTVFAAREIYGIFDPITALVVMFLSTAFVALASVKYKSAALSLTSLVLAGVAPLLTNVPSPDYVSLFTYLLVVILGAIWIVVLTGRRELTFAALVLVSAYSVPHLGSFVSTEEQILLIFAYVFSGIFFITNTIGIIKAKEGKSLIDLVTAVGSGLFLLYWIIVAGQEEWRSLIICAWMLLFVVGAFMIFKATKRKEPSYIYTGVGVLMLAAATALELSGAVLTIAYSLEAIIISLLTYFVLRDIKMAQKVSLLLIVPMAMAVPSIIRFMENGKIFGKDFFAISILALILVGMGFFFRRNMREFIDEQASKINAFLIVIGSLYWYILLWVSLHSLIPSDDMAVMISLVIYTILGLVIYFYGMAEKKKGFSIYGGLLLGFVVGRLMFVDVWQMALTGKIITFFFIGALLVSTAFFGRKKSDNVLNSIKKD